MRVLSEAMIKTIPKKKKCKKAKWLFEEDLQIAEKRREAKGKGKKERYKHLNSEVQRIARREKKAFLSYQCKEIEENNRMGKTRDLFENPMDREAWWATVHRVAKSQTQLSDLAWHIPKDYCATSFTIAVYHVQKSCYDAH